jgi:arylsulfatase
MAVTSWRTLLSGLAAASALAWAPAALAAERPNFLIIVADDLGYSDVGAFGGEIETPNLDALAMSGVRFTGFHTASACAPTRAMLMTGADHHQVGQGTMVKPSPEQEGKPGYEGYLTDKAVTVAQLLHDGGYRTLMSGKWHLGLTAERSPAARGFERSFALMQGGANHFGADQDGATTFLGGHSTYFEDGKPTRFPKDGYSSDVFADKMIGFIEEGRADRRPFFGYLTFTAPHWPLQAPADIIDKYRGRYDAGPEALAAERLAKLKKLGLVGANVTPHPLEGVKPWASLTPEERAVEARKMEVYAAMVDRMDQAVGRVVAKLKETGQFDNTVIIFLADNGAEGNLGDEDGRWGFTGFSPKVDVTEYDNSLANIGKVNSFVAYGNGWAQAATTPSWLYKGFTSQGGIRAPAFVSGPGVAGGGRISRGFLSVTDITPTALDLAGVARPATYAGKPTIPVLGRSWAPVLHAKAEEVRTADDAVGWELFGSRAIRKGDWKIVYRATGVVYDAARTRPGAWRLFNLRTDPGETTDLSASQPAKLKELLGEWRAYVARTGVAVIFDDAAKPAPAAAAAAAGR